MSNHNPHVVPVNALNFASEVLESKLPVLIDVSAAWCPPCRAAAPIVAELAEQHQGSLKVVEIDGDESPELVANLNVRGFPTFLGIANGNVVVRSAGFGGKRQLTGLTATLLAGADGAVA